MIQLIAGTNRPESNTRIVVRHVEDAYKAIGVSFGVLDLADLPPAIFAPSSYGEKPAAFDRFSRAVTDADGLVVVTPEYNGGMPGILKYFIDMLKFPDSFQDRPVCFIGLAAGRWGALRPVEQLQQIFGYRNAHLFPERLFLPGINDLLDEKGDFTDADMLARLQRQAEGFTRFVERLKGVSLRGAPESTDPN